MTTLTKKEALHRYRGWCGQDASREVSLFDYGLLWRLEGKAKDEWRFLYRIGETEEGTIFDWSWMDRGEWIDLCTEDWFRIADVCAFIGMGEHDLIGSFPEGVADALSFHGYENIFGSSYGSGVLVKG